ncbi:MAG: hypothetical protein K6G47_10135 [Clostridia bacterium]|nr:hypothetical protein [Clostridia bacterium]
MRCPNCGANLIYKDKKYICEFCGHEQKEKVEVAKNNYNIVISHSNGTSSAITIRIIDAHIEYTLRVNSTVSFKLVPGPHTIEFQEYGRKDVRVVNVPDNGEAVKVDYSFDAFRRDPVIIRITEPGQDPHYSDPARVALLPAKKTGLTVAALIMGCCGLSIPAIIMGTISVNRAKKAGRKEHGLDVLAQVLGYVWFFIHLLFLSALVRN